jgi:3-dehydroquinate dehydratase / shikimate dehydrogenase
MTMLVTSITADTTDDMQTKALDALERGSDAVELRLDSLKTSGGMAGIAEDLPSGTWIVTCRTASEGGAFRGPVEQQVEHLIRAGLAGEGFIDFEYRQWQKSPLARTELGKPITDSAGIRHPAPLILSYHDFEGRPNDLDDIVAQMCAVPEAIAVKIAWPAADIMSNFEALDIMRFAPKDIIAICMGEAGLLSRVLAKKFGAFASYASLSEAEASAPGQATLDAMLHEFGWGSIDVATQVYGVIGSPVAHSLSPMVFNGAFRAGRVPGVYVPLLVEPDYESFAAFMDACVERDWLDVRGFSVTLPHKENALRYLGDRIDPPADMIGAINTIRIEDGEVWGCNTDSPAAVEAILEAMGCEDDALEGVPVAVLGAGGVSRAVVAGLVDCGCDVTIYNRTRERADSLAERFGCRAEPWEDAAKTEAKILVNCTSIGMWPDSDATPISADVFRKDMVVFDTIYRPMATRLLREADAAGCRTVGGASMFVRQAAQQFEYWTQQPADEAYIAQLVASALSESESKPEPV